MTATSLRPLCMAGGASHFNVALTDRSSLLHTAGVATHLLRNDGLVVFQDQPLDVMSP